MATTNISIRMDAALKKEADQLFEIIRQLRKDRGVIYISHYFGEILDLCDTVTAVSYTHLKAP